MTQSIFKFNLATDYSIDKFLISKSNRAAYAYATSLPWQFYALSIYGPSGSGKSHLANIISKQPNLKIVEDVTTSNNQNELLHNLNFARENNNYILLTSQKPLTELGFTLPDLTSRLSAIISIPINVPDNELLIHLLKKNFTDRQLKVNEEVINFLASRVERNFAALKEIIAKIDHLSLEQRRNITIPLIKEIIS